jgi:uncharacterized protein YfaS (alpha-2-macroglobulin family)
VRSAIVNTADRKVVKSLDLASIVTDANLVGTGRENLQAAVKASVALDPVSVSFGAVPSGSGQSLRANVTLTNITAASQTYTLAVDEAAGSGVGFGVTRTSVTVAPGESASVAVTLVAQKGAAAGPNQAVLKVSTANGVVANAMLYALVK